MLHPTASREEVISVAYELSTKYGEGASALACEMYDETAAAQGALVPSAEPAATATLSETGKMVNSLYDRIYLIPAEVARQVKQASADTMLKNAARDGSEFAWIPNGDTCAFCLTLASRGWQHISRKSLRNGHAGHIHAHCDCEYQVRFDGESSVEGYDPEAYYEKYKSADGRKPQDKINALRREKYSQDKDYINAQKRAAYARRIENDKK